MSYNLDLAIRKIPNFPHEGILFYDVTGILTNPEAFGSVIDRMEALYASKGFGAIAAVESRGFVFAAPLAARLGLPLILVRKKGKLPGKKIQKSYSLEYGEATIEVHVDDVRKDMKILLVDDLLATGGTLKAAADLLEEAGGHVSESFCVIGLPFLHPERTLGALRVTTLIDYAGEKIPNN